jgi:hypothetical protein
MKALRQRGKLPEGVLVDDPGDVLITSRVWRIDGNYCLSGKHELLHRLILPVTDGQVVDHINGNTLDNRRANLRAVDNSINGLNRHNTQGCCGVPGVQYEAHRVRPYRVRIKRQRYGSFVTLESATVKAAEVRADLIKEALL